MLGGVPYGGVPIGRRFPLAIQSDQLAALEMMVKRNTEQLESHSVMLLKLDSRMERLEKKMEEALALLRK